jgi:hypothetical protein
MIALEKCYRHRPNLNIKFISYFIHVSVRFLFYEPCKVI